MKFSGLQKISLIDYPDKVASVLFTPGCNLRCGFCHNWRIVVDPKPPFLHEAQALEILEKRKRYVDAVVVTGGEPCMHKELPKFLAKLKDADSWSRSAHSSPACWGLSPGSAAAWCSSRC